MSLKRTFELGKLIHREVAEEDKERIDFNKDRDETISHKVKTDWRRRRDAKMEEKQQ